MNKNTTKLRTIYIGPKDIQLSYGQTGDVTFESNRVPKNLFLFTPDGYIDEKAKSVGCDFLGFALRSEYVYFPDV